jgi:ankyrin repeat protein
MTTQLPPRPNIEQLKKQAKALLKGQQASNPGVLRQIRQHHPRFREKPEPEIRNSRFTLSDAQLVVAGEYGFASWPKLKAAVLARQAGPSSEGDRNAWLGAASRGELAQVTALLDQHSGLLDERGGEGTRTALHFAAMHGHEAVVRLLLERGADPNIRCEGDYAMPLHFAAEKQHFPIIRLLLENGADPSGEGDYHELDVIGWATSWDYVTARKEIVEYLTAHGAAHNIFSAVAMGEVEIIRKLAAQSRSHLEKRMDLTNKRRRPLHLAVVKKQPRSLEALLDLGANTEALDESGFTALDQAALSGETELAQILLDRSAKVRLPAAFALQKSSDIEKLLRRDPECLRSGNRWGNLIVRASEQASGQVVESLIRAGACVDVWDDPKTAVDSTSGYAPLHAAGFWGNAGAAAVLLQHGANVRARDEKYQGTPAGWAAFAGHAAVRDLILQGPIDIFEAIEMNRADRIAGILDREPAAIERPFGEYLNAPPGTPRAVLSFLEGVRRDGRYTPLAFAAAAGNTAAAQALLDRGADRTVRAPDGRTLLQVAQETGHAAVVELLQRHGLEA